MEQPEVPKVLAITACRTNARWASLPWQGKSDRDIGYPLQPSELAVERDLELSNRFTWSEGCEWWSVHRTRIVITGTSFLGSRNALASDMGAQGPSWISARGRVALCKKKNLAGGVGRRLAQFQCKKGLRERQGAGYFGPLSKFLPLDPRRRL